MPGRRHAPEQIIRKLREAEVELAKGHKLRAVCRRIGITDQTYYRWRKEYGGPPVLDLRRSFHWSSVSYDVDVWSRLPVGRPDALSEGNWSAGPHS
jgi:hypothetical protein